MEYASTAIRGSFGGEATFHRPDRAVAAAASPLPPGQRRPCRRWMYGDAWPLLLSSNLHQEAAMTGAACMRLTSIQEAAMHLSLRARGKMQPHSARTGWSSPQCRRCRTAQLSGSAPLPKWRRFHRPPHPRHRESRHQRPDPLGKSIRGQPSKRMVAESTKAFEKRKKKPRERREQLLAHECPKQMFWRVSVVSASPIPTFPPLFSLS